MESSSSYLELFLPSSLPSWVRYFVVVMFFLQISAVALYSVFLCRECTRPKETYAKVKLSE
jgi:hypothetical protein